MSLCDGRIGALLDGKYRLEELLARGGMGLVYAARHQATGRAVAVKLIRSDFVTRPDFAQRIANEARLAVEASHPNVVEVLDAGADEGGGPYLVLERLRGRTLEALLSSPLPLFTTAQALIPLMNALSALHAVRIVHRDVKPSNAFVSQDANGRVTPKLLDFGIAKTLEEEGLTLSGVALGTPAYMSPEQALGCKTLGPETDVWSMAVVWLHCLTLSLPFESRATQGLGALRAGLEARDLRGVAAPLARVLTRALCFEPADRYPTMADFRDAILLALSSVDPSRAWPDSEAVSFSPSETELWSRLGAQVRAATEPVAPPGVANERVTRTLSGVGIAPLARRPSRLSAALVAGAGLAVAGAIYVGFSRHTESGVSRPEPGATAKSEASSVDAMIAVAARAPEDKVAPTATAEPERSLVSATREGKGQRSPDRLPRGSSGPASPTAPARVFRPSEASQRLEPSVNTEAAPAAASVLAPSERVGANRAPILE